MACWRRTLALVATLLLTVNSILRGTCTAAAVPPEGVNYQNQIEPWQDFSEPEITEIQPKRASNLGSRNCGAFNLGKKFVGYTSWLGPNALRQRRTQFYTNTNSNLPVLQRAEPYWWLRNY